MKITYCTNCKQYYYTARRKHCVKCSQSLIILPIDFVEFTNMDTPNITFYVGTEAEQQNIFRSLTHRKAMISFNTKEDIDNRANGDYHVYFQ